VVFFFQRDAFLEEDVSDNVAKNVARCGERSIASYKSSHSPIAHSPFLTPDERADDAQLFVEISCFFHQGFFFSAELCLGD